MATRAPVLDGEIFYEEQLDSCCCMQLAEIEAHLIEADSKNKALSYQLKELLSTVESIITMSAEESVNVNG
jgi:hypothetical protein